MTKKQETFIEKLKTLFTLDIEEEKEAPKKKEKSNEHVVNHIKDNLDSKQGFSGMKKSLKNMGYSEKEIKDHFNKAITKKKEELVFAERAVISLCFLSFLSFMVFLMLANEVSFLKVVIGTVPTLLSIMTVIALLNRVKHNIWILTWFMPFIYSLVGFFAAFYSGLDIFIGMNLQVLFLMNVVFSFILIAPIHFVVFLKNENR